MYKLVHGWVLASRADHGLACRVEEMVRGRLVGLLTPNWANEGQAGLGQRSWMIG